MQNMNQMMKQAQVLQGKMAAIQKELATKEVSGSAGNGKVQVLMTAKGEVLSIKIDPSVVDPEDCELLEDLVLTAIKNAKSAGDKLSNDEMQKLGIPNSLLG